MHIHDRSMAIQAMGFYSATQQERTAAARRAAEIRKRLLRASRPIEDDQPSLLPDETPLIRHWLNAHHDPTLAKDEYTPVRPAGPLIEKQATGDQETWNKNRGRRRFWRRNSLTCQ